MLLLGKIPQFFIVLKTPYPQNLSKDKIYLGEDSWDDWFKI